MRGPASAILGAGRPSGGIFRKLRPLSFPIVSLDDFALIDRTLNSAKIPCSAFNRMGSGPNVYLLPGDRFLVGRKFQFRNYRRRRLSNERL